MIVAPDEINEFRRREATLLSHSANQTGRDVNTFALMTDIGPNFCLSRIRPMCHVEKLQMISMFFPKAFPD